MARRRALGRALTGFAENFMPAWQSMQYMDRLRSSDALADAREERLARRDRMDEIDRQAAQARELYDTEDELRARGQTIADSSGMPLDVVMDRLQPGLMNRGERIQGVVEALGQLAAHAPPELVESVAEEKGLSAKRRDMLPSIQLTGTAPLAGPVVGQRPPRAGYPDDTGAPFETGALPPDLLEGASAADLASLQKPNIEAFTPLKRVAQTDVGWGPQWEATQKGLLEGERARQGMIREFATEEQVRERSTEEMLDNKYLQAKIDREVAEKEADPTRFDAFENWKKQQDWTIENWSMQTGLQAERAAIMEHATVPGRLAFYEGQLDLAYESDQRRAEFDVAQRALVEAAALNERLQDEIRRATGLEFETLQRAQDLRDSRAAGIQLNYQQQGELDRVTGALGKARVLFSVAEREGVLDAETRELIKRAQGPLSDEEFKQYKRRQILNTVLNAPAETFAIQYGADGNPSESLMLSRDKNTGEWRYDSMGAFHPELHDDYVSGGPYAGILGAAFQAMTGGDVGPVPEPQPQPQAEPGADPRVVGKLKTQRIPDPEAPGGFREVTGPAEEYWLGGPGGELVTQPSPEEVAGDRWNLGGDAYAGPPGVETRFDPVTQEPTFFRKNIEGPLQGFGQVAVPIPPDHLLAVELDPGNRRLQQLYDVEEQAKRQLSNFQGPMGEIITSPQWPAGDASRKIVDLRNLLDGVRAEQEALITRQQQIKDWFRPSPGGPLDRSPGQGGFTTGDPLELGR